VRVWCAATGELARVVLSGASRVRAVAFSEVSGCTTPPPPELVLSGHAASLTPY